MTPEHDAELAAIDMLFQERRALLDEIRRECAGLRVDVATLEDENAIALAAVIKTREELGEAIALLAGLVYVARFVSEVLPEIATDHRVVTARAWLDAREQKGSPCAD